MSLNPKLEFFRFILKPKDKNFKTFKEFLIELLGLDSNTSDEEIKLKFFKYFLNSLEKDIAKDDKLKKRIALIDNSEVNEYLKFKPKLNSNQNIISGVINGGNYGRKRILSKNSINTESSKMNIDDSVLQYFYFHLYIPLDHNEGCVMIQSNSSSESITNIFRKFLGLLLKSQNYHNMGISLFCPQKFQNEFKYESRIQNISFINSFVDSIPSSEGIGNKLDEYDIIIKVVPKNKDIPIDDAPKLKRIFSKFTLKRGDNFNEDISNFSKTKFEVKNRETKTNKTFEWNTKDNEFAPVIYLDGRIENFNLDGTPDFGELDSFCMNLFSSDILPELRPDFNVKRIN